MDDLKKYISEITDFPKKGILFKDLNPIYKNPRIWNLCMLKLEQFIKLTEPDFIAGIDSRGFIIGSALAYKLDIGFIPIRKKNKLPGKVIGIEYKLEYGIDRLEIQIGSVSKNEKVLIVDDLLATGGTASTAGKLIKATGGNLIGYGFLVELSNMNGRNCLDNNLSIESVIKY